MPDVFKREMQKGRYDSIYNTGGRAKGKKKKNERDKRERIATDKRALAINPISKI